MRKHERAMVGTCVAAALAWVTTLAGCDPYPAASGVAAPQILGVMVTDINGNAASLRSPTGSCSVTHALCAGDLDCNGQPGSPLGYCSIATLESCAADGDCGGHCSATTTWGCAGAADCLGNCSTTTTEACRVDDECPPGETCNYPPPGNCSITTTQSCIRTSDCPSGETCSFVPPQTCQTAPAQTCVLSTATPQTCVLTPELPPRDGPVFAPDFLGGPVASPATWTLAAVPAGNWPSPKYGPFLFASPRVIFNELMDAASIQPAPASCGGAPDVQVTAAIRGTATTDVTASFGVCYDPSSTSPGNGASMFLSTAAGKLVRASTYHITGTVEDKQNRSVSVDLTIETAP